MAGLLERFRGRPALGDAGASPPGWKRWVALAGVAACVIVAAWPLLVLARIFASRLTLAEDVDWQEGIGLEEAWRLTHFGPGTTVYGDPGLGWQALVYPPAYYVLVGAVGRLVGLDYATGRSISVLAIVASFALVFHTVRAHARTRIEGLGLATLAVGALAVAFAFMPIYDYVMKDSLGIALILGAVASLGGRSPPTVRRAVGAALLCVVAAFTKQTHAAVGVWLAIHTLARSRRAGLAFTGTAAAAGLGLLLAMQLATDGWFLFWLTLPSHQKISPQVLGVLVSRLLRPAPYVVLAAAGPLLLMAWRRASAATVLWWGALIFSAPLALLGYIKIGGAENNFEPIVFTAVPTAALTAIDWLDGPARDRRWRAPALAAVLLAGILHVTLHWFSPGRYLPTAEQRAEGLWLRAFVAQMPGGVVVPSHPWIARRVDPDTAQLEAMGYIENWWASDHGPLMRHGRVVRAAMAADIERIRPGWVIMSSLEEDVVAPQLLLHYRPWCRFAPPAMVYNAATLAVSVVYRRRDAGPEEKAPAVGGAVAPDGLPSCRAQAG